MKVTEEMVSRFLGWRLPNDFAPDAGIKFTPSNHPDAMTHLWPVGTNLFNADQARAMLEHVLSHTSEKKPSATAYTVVQLIEEREKLDVALGRALEREYPIDSLVYWRHGQHEQAGRVKEHWGTRLRARNVNTGKYKDLEAWSIYWEEKQRNKKVSKGRP